ncbi:hypothetical protein BDQ12DRAFT_663434 [Crucibulum laeve]|uniref:Uncharacterized protein n=1 Tax=Crucibulum laeve TaxID=68775 RepID=A0A5C3MBB8_9AGAR|nr:hypothetical protein BDQ12DRAFT_663434 [Crucibulum laeve]
MAATSTISGTSTPPANEPELNVRDITNSVRETFAILEPWLDAGLSPNIDDRVKKDIHNINICANEYVTAIDFSVKIAQNGQTIAVDALHLCSLMEKQQDGLDLKTVSEFQKYIGDILSKAKKAHADAEQISSKFRNVRRKLNEISKGIPKIVESIKNTPEDVILVPKPVPSLTRKKKLRISRELSKRDVNDAPLAETLSQVSSALLVLETLQKDLDSFIKWWFSMISTLRYLRDTSDFASPEHQLRMSAIRTKWEQVNMQYKEYESEVASIKDYYPKTLPRMYHGEHIPPSPIVDGRPSLWDIPDRVLDDITRSARPPLTSDKEPDAPNQRSADNRERSSINSPNGSFTSNGAHTEIAHGVSPAKAADTKTVAQKSPGPLTPVTPERGKPKGANIYTKDKLLPNSSYVISKTIVPENFQPVPRPDLIQLLLRDLMLHRIQFLATICCIR